MYIGKFLNKVLLTPVFKGIDKNIPKQVHLKLKDDDNILFGNIEFKFGNEQTIKRRFTPALKG